MVRDLFSSENILWEVTAISFFKKSAIGAGNKPKITDFIISIRIDINIFWFNIQVHQIGTVNVVESLSNLPLSRMRESLEIENTSEHYTTVFR